MKTAGQVYAECAFYRLIDLPEEGLKDTKQRLKEFLSSRNVLGTLLLSKEGINGMLCVPLNFEPEVRTLFENDFGISNWKVSQSSSRAFGHLYIKVKKHVIPGFWRQGQNTPNGIRLDPEALKTWLDKDQRLTLLDTRNQFEYEKGTFEGAISLNLKTFRQFEDRFLSALNDGSISRDKPLVMFCTGGIRCEKATALARAHGIEDVYQLEGGILKYFEKCGNAHYRGTCFVFDERVSLDKDLCKATPSDKQAESSTISEH